MPEGIYGCRCRSITVASSLLCRPVMTITSFHSGRAITTASQANRLAPRFCPPPAYITPAYTVAYAWRSVKSGDKHGMAPIESGPFLFSLTHLRRQLPGLNSLRRAINNFANPIRLSFRDRVAQKIALFAGGTDNFGKNLCWNQFAGSRQRYLLYFC
jgi:hypothetical protein